MRYTRLFRDLRYLSAAVSENRLLENAPMAQFTTFRVGGPADVLLDAADEAEIAAAIRTARAADAPVTIIGYGSNLLVRDGGIPGLVVRIGPAMAQLRIEGTTVCAQAGISLGALARAAADASLQGLAFASGIPGALGGAAAMNAGAYGGEMAQVITRVRVLDAQLQGQWLDRAALDYGYRRSAVLARGLVVTQAELSLQRGDRAEILAQMRELAQRRREKQPLQYPSAGSTFKRPEGHFAGKLIEDAGLRGHRVGGAQVSEQHAGFVINTGDATARDVLTLMDEIRARVYARFGVMLEPEVRIVGEDA